MKRLVASLFFTMSLATGSFGQRTVDVGFSGGVVNYIGDLANEEYFPFSSAAPGAAVTFRNFINNPARSGSRFPLLDLQVRLSWHRLQYDETAALCGEQGTDLRNYLRGLSFRNDLFGVETGVTYNFYLNRNSPLWKPSFSFFLMAGVGMFYGQPKADLFRGEAAPENRYYFWNDGTVRDRPENPGQIGEVTGRDGQYETNLRDWYTEGQGYNKEISQSNPYDLWNVGIPLGAGIRYMYNKQLTISAEFNYYYFFTDYLDDASDRYATYEELKAAFPDDREYELSKYISDPTGRGTNGYTGQYTSPRGNPKMKDSFTYLSVEASYKLTWKKRGIYGR